MTETTNPEVSLQEVAITRVFDAPRERVFDAWTVADAFAQWWGPRGTHSPRETVEIDARPGGHWKATIVMEATEETERVEQPFFGVYRELVRPERLSFTLGDPLDPEFLARSEAGEGEELVTLTFTERDGGTEMKFLQVGYLPAETVPKAVEGWGSFFDCLAEYLAKP
ncbi:SRPBCC family protein [Sphaerisporangium fuscum]|uniref:SRPBCC family protein n=1 Tax=Sphaerisporangium fuscum TaxID=2835868 RepID=UPI001BDDC2D6|nr:SRPBCC domain-containing protein [Sphaerisporangium fuscum]